MVSSASLKDLLPPIGGFVLACLSSLNRLFLLGILAMMCIPLLESLKAGLSRAGEKAELETEATRFLTFLASYLKTEPNLEAGARYAASISHRSLRKHLAPYFPRILLGEPTEALKRFARRHGLRELESAVSTLVKALNLPDHERQKILDRLLVNRLKSMRERSAEFIAWLQMPLMTIYSLTILVPLLIVPISPALSVFGFQSINYFLISLLGGSLLVAYILCLLVLSKSPEPRRGGCSFNPVGILLAAISAIPGFALPSGVRAFYLLWVPPLCLTVHTWRSDRYEHHELNLDMLRHMGHKLREGEAIEQIFSKLELPESPLVSKIKCGTHLPELLPNNLLAGTLKGPLELANKNPREAGKLLTHLADHLEELDRVQKEYRRRMNNVLSSMKSLGLFFGPIALAITSQILLFLGFQPLFSLSLNHSTVTLAFGYYSMGLAAMLTWLCGRLEGKGPQVIAGSIPKAILISLSTFTVATIVGKQFVGLLAPP